MNQKIVIIGAGVAGLSAGCYAQMNGYDAEIVEMHSISGGLCTGWRRKGYTFDGCIHFLTGTNQKSWLHGFWQAVGALGETEIVDPQTYMQVEGPSGRKLTLFCDLEKLQSHMLSISPEDSGLIQEFIEAVRTYSTAGNPGRLGAIGMTEFAREFKSQVLRASLSVFRDTQFFLSTMAAYSRRDAGWPIGGSLALIRGMEKRFLELGGRIRLNAKVDEVMAENGRATGVRLADGTVISADRVLSAADGHETIYGILHGKYICEQIDKLYTRGKAYPTSVQVSLGIGCDLSGEPGYLHLTLDEPIEAAGDRKSSILIKHYCHDKTLCPAGKSVVTVLLSSNYEYWEKLGRGSAAYKGEKEKIISAITAVLERRFPAAKGKIEVADVATPLTYERYTGAWNGAYMGWMSTPEAPAANIPTTLPGLAGFYMTGQWTYPRGGLPTALMTARGTLMRICAEDGKTFAEG